jgi:hypothetical protein
MGVDVRGHRAVCRMAHPLELAEPSVIDEELIRNCITTVEEMSIPEDKKKEMKTETELHDIKVRKFLLSLFLGALTSFADSGPQLQLPKYP